MRAMAGGVRRVGTLLEEVKVKKELGDRSNAINMRACASPTCGMAFASVNRPISAAPPPPPPSPTTKTDGWNDGRVVPSKCVEGQK
jgi:hypothetical protein